MTNDPTEDARREMVREINAEPGSREELVKTHGETWDTVELQRDFEVLAFAAPFVIVKRRRDGQRGALMFQHHPRYYFDFQPA